MSELLKISEMQMQKVWKYFIWTYFIFAAVYFLLLDASNLPDYAAYAGIFTNPEVIREPLFVFFNNAFRGAGQNYENFRNVLLLFSLTSLLYLLLSVQELEPIPKILKSNVGSIILTAYVLTIFILEFFVIRIRAGLAIALLCIGIAVILRAPKHFFSWTLLLISVCAAFFVHKSSATILVLTFGVTALPLLNGVKPASWHFWIINDLGLKLIYLLVAGTLLFLVLTQNQVRSGVVISVLNPIRLICLGIIPLMLFSVTRLLRNQMNQYFYRPNIWVLSFENFYVVLAIELLIIYWLGLTNDSGEALVRFYTLLSFPALIAFISAGGIFASPLCAYLLTINASFFLATLNMYPDFVIQVMRLLGKS